MNTVAGIVFIAVSGATYLLPGFDLVCHREGPSLGADHRMRKTVDVYLNDRLVASYPVVVKAIDRPTDNDFVERMKQQMRSYYRSEDIQAARFVVRGVQD